MRIMLDANILVSGMVFLGNESLLLDLIDAKGHTLVISDYIENEVRDVLNRKFPTKEHKLTNYIKTVKVQRIPLPPRDKIQAAEKIIRDLNDAIILASIIDNKLDIFVSGDKDFHTPEIKDMIKVLSTKEAIEILRRK